MKKLKILFSIVLCLCLSFTTVNTYAQMPNGETTQANETRAGEEAVFKDVKPIDWYYDAAMFVNSRGFMTGMSPGIFGGSTKLSRAQFATILHRMAGTKKVPYEKKFKDVPKGTFFTDAVMWASSKGIITGYTEGPTKGYFGASDYITREQMAVMMYRYADALGIDVSGRSDLNTFKDGKKTSPFAKDQMSWAVSYGLISGNDNGTLVPQGTAARAECATIIMRYTQKNEESGGITREDWIVSLMDTLGKDTTSEIDEYSFNDTSETDSPEVIETAYRWSMIPGYDGTTKVNFEPKAPATREFIAYSTIHGLGYALEETELQFSDSNQCAYLLEDEYMVSLGLLSDKDGAFVPSGTIKENEKQELLNKITDLIGIGEEKEVIDYADGVKESTMDYDLNEQGQQITTSESEAKNWKPGEIHTLINEENPEDSVAIKVQNVTTSGGQTSISYTTPELEEVIDKIDMSGSTQTGTFVPDPEIDVENMPMTRANGSGEISLSKEISFSKKVNVKGNKVEILKGSLGIDSIDYQFDVDADLFGIDVNRVYVVLNSKANISSNINIENLVNDDLKYEFTLGTLRVPIAGVFFIEGNLNAIVDLDGNFTFKYELKNKAGIDYNEGKFKTIFDIKQELKDLSLQGELKAGFEIEPAVSFLGIEVASIGAEFGRTFEGKVEVVQIQPFQFCLDSDTYIYAGVSADLLNGWKTFDKPVLTKEDGIGRKHYHFEESGKVEQCTRSMGDYTGKVVSGEDGSPLEGIQVFIYRGDYIAQWTFTNSNGEFKGEPLEKGNYTLSIMVKGYEKYTQNIKITAGKTLDLSTITLVKTQPDPSEEVSIEDATVAILNAGDTIRIRNMDYDTFYKCFHIIQVGSEEVTYDVVGYDKDHMYDSSHQSSYVSFDSTPCDDPDDANYYNLVSYYSEFRCKSGTMRIIYTNDNGNPIKIDDKITYEKITDPIFNEYIIRPGQSIIFESGYAGDINSKNDVHFFFDTTRDFSGHEYSSLYDFGSDTVEVSDEDMNNQWFGYVSLPISPSIKSMRKFTCYSGEMKFFVPRDDVGTLNFVTVESSD